MQKQDERERERERMEIKRKDIHTVGKKKGTFTKDKKTSEY